MRGPRTLRVIAGAGHFFEGGQAELAAAVREAVEGGVLASVVGMAP
jgi:alpha/beta superfamily hydrolase